MKSFQSLQEERGEKAFKQAISMGLQYSGFGYWKDPQTGETKFKTENDTLVPVEQDESSEKYTGGGPGEGMGQASGGGMGMGGMQGMMNPAGMLQMPGMGGQMPGQNIGDAPMPGQEKAEFDKSWEAGPDGDTCAGPDAKPQGVVPKDSFVGRSNFLKWTAGPDGDNLSTVDSIETMQQRIREDAFILEAAPIRRMSAADRQYSPYKAAHTRDLNNRRPEAMGFVIEKMIQKLMTKLFPDGEHEHLDAQDMGTRARKADLESRVGDDTIQTSIKSHAGGDHPGAYFNDETMHSPRDLAEFLQLDDNRARDGARLFDNLDFNMRDADSYDRESMDRLMKQLDERKGMILDRAIHGRQGENIEQLITMSMNKGYGGQRLRDGHPSDNQDLSKIMGRVTARQVDGNKLKEAIENMNWQYDRGRGIFLSPSQDVRDSIVNIQAPMMRHVGMPFERRQGAEIHMQRKPMHDAMPLMWDAHVKFDHPSRDAIEGKNYAVSGGSLNINEDNPLVQRLKAAREESGGGGVVKGGLSPADLAKMNNAGAPNVVSMKKKDELGEDFNTAQKRGRQIVGGSDAEGTTNVRAHSALNAIEKNNSDLFGRQLLDIAGIAKKGMDHKMKEKARELPQLRKDVDLVKNMNDTARPLMQDPDYDLSIGPNDKQIGEGAFGAVYKKPDGNVVKTGGIGPDELKALHAMQSNPRFPTLINGRFDEPFKHQSSVYNNPRDSQGFERDTGEVDYWDPEEASDFDRKFPTAMGTYAMSAAGGAPLMDVIEDMDEEQRDKILRNFWRARGDLHKAGFSHNDMHGGNIMVDDDGNVNIIDLGLAKNNRLSALMEAMGGMNYEQGEDYQLSHHVSGSSLPQRMRDMFDLNLGEVEDLIRDNMSWDDDDYEDTDDEGMSKLRRRAMDTIDDLTLGDIRMTQKDFDRIREDIPYLGDDNNVEKLIKMLYNEVGNSELADRMSDAFSDRQKETKRASSIDGIINSIRSGGKSDRGVIPRRNMDFDD